MSLTRTLPVSLLPVCLLAAWVAMSPAARPAAADEPSLVSEAAEGDLELRILPPPGKTESAYVASVGSPFELRYELKNRGNEPLLLPLDHPHFCLGLVRYVTTELPSVGGRGWGPAPFRNRLTELAPGETRERTLRLTPSLHGPATVAVDLVCLHEQVTDLVPVTRKVDETLSATHFERKRVDEPRLWHGHLRVEARLDVVFTGHHVDGGPIDGRDVRKLWKRETPLLERLDVLGRLAVLDPSSRAVDEFRKGFGVRARGPAWPAVVRRECAKQLAIAAKKGYGIHGLKTLLAVCRDEKEDADVRLLALEGLAIALDEKLEAAEGDCEFRLAILPVWHEQTVLLFADLSTRQTALGVRAKAILEARAVSPEEPTAPESREQPE